MANKISVLRDTKEKLGFWTFSGYPKIATTSKALVTGDYTIDQYEDRFVIERKKTFKELASNLGRHDHKRFYAEIDRLSKVEHSFIIIETTLEEFYLGCSFSRLTPHTVHSHLLNFQLQGIQVIFGGWQSEWIASKLIEKAGNKWGLIN